MDSSELAEVPVSKATEIVAVSCQILAVMISSLR